MTDEEIKEYNQLSPTFQYYYNIGMRNNKNWTHAQAFAYAQICGAMETTPPDTEPKDPILIFREVLKKALDFVQREFPKVYIKVKTYFARAIDWLNNAVNVTINKIT